MECANYRLAWFWYSFPCKYETPEKIGYVMCCTVLTEMIFVTEF